MESEVLVKVEGVSKKFCRTLRRSLWYGIRDMTSEFLGRNGRHDILRKDEFWAVNDVSFELKRGECLGLIGHNGAGKSTLLKMLNGLIKPDKGRITMKGRVGALIELGAGFNPILTGRENIYVNGQILGLTKRQIDDRLESIIDFAEIRDFIDTPVQNYSSGMKVRLGFAVAAQMEPDILIIDEVLAVGDLGFRIKCFNQITKLLNNTAVILVSHQMPQILRICNVAILMNNGAVLYSSTDVAKTVSEYYKLFGNNSYHKIGDLIRIEKLIVNGSSGTQFEIVYNSNIRLSFSFVSLTFVNLIRISLVLFDLEERAIGSDVIFLDNVQANKSISIDYEMPCLSLNNGSYSMSIVFLEMVNDAPKVLTHYNSIIKLISSGNPLSMPGPFRLKGSAKISC